MLYQAPAFRLHLRAALVAGALALGLICLAFTEAVHLERRFARALVPESLSLKNQGLALQRAAFAQGDVLPLYGSSELVKDIPDKASLFFRRYPTDFAVCPVGKAGSTSLILAQKLGAVGPELKGKQVVLSLSPSWFLTGRVNGKTYAGNFSGLQASEVAFAAELSPELRQAMAGRMLDYPETLAEHPLLHFALRHLAVDSAKDRTLYHLTMPFGWLDNALVRLQDHIETGFYIAQHGHRLKAPSHRELDFNWQRLTARWSNRTGEYLPRRIEHQANAEAKYAEGDEAFLHTLEHAPEWGDLELLLRVLHELGAKPLVLSVPMNGTFFDAVNVSADARHQYYERLRKLTSAYGVAEVDFEEHEHDKQFFADTYDHPSAKGWIFFDEAMDAFVHGRPLPGGLAENSRGAK